MAALVRDDMGFLHIGCKSSEIDTQGLTRPTADGTRFADIHK
jgi:hypothetical protein